MVLQEVYKPVGTSSDFTSTCAFPFGPASEFKQRLIVQTAGLKRDFQSPAPMARAVQHRWFNSGALNHLQANTAL
jgi:hypothetical protein